MKMLEIMSNFFWCTCFFVSMAILPSTSSKQYRTDYVYNKKTDAFYKFHMESTQYESSKDMCALEGAELMVPQTEEDVSQAHGMFKQYPDIGNLAWIANEGKAHDSIEVVPIINLDVDSFTEHEYRGENTFCVVVTRYGKTFRTTCREQLPFICKVHARETFQNNLCKVYGRGYKYIEQVGSCYKIPELALEWEEAYSECRAEGAHLIVINSELEHRVIFNYTHEEHPVKNARTPWTYFVGIRAEKTTDGSPLVFKTIFNQTMEEAGYSTWSENEPNNALGNEYCVTIFKNDGKYNDIYCHHRYAFICENEVHK